MNFEKLSIITILQRKDATLLQALSVNHYKRPAHKTLFKALQSYNKQFGKIPTIDVLSSAIQAQMEAEKASTYVSMLESFKDYEGELPSSEEIIKSLEDAYIIANVDAHIEQLVEASKAKDIETVKNLLSKLDNSVSTSTKKPENILDVTYEPSKIRVIDSCMESMRAASLKMGGLVLIGGSSGGGKSIYTLKQLMYSFSVDKIPTCLLNMELGLDETIARMYSQDTGKDFAGIYGNTDPSIIASVNSWKQKYFTSDVEFRIKSVRYSISEIEQTIRNQASQGIVLFGIDYLQIADLDVSNEEWKQLSNLVRLLHQLTQELQIVIISPVQINFTDTKIKDNELHVTIRGSRELEFSASVFLFIYQTAEEYKENVCRIFTIKARNAKKQIYLTQTDFARMNFIDTGVVM
jgi:replicative DNA helicase